jgi:ABC-type uncharacterized transport system substrate-binding protein
MTGPSLRWVIAASGLAVTATSASAHPHVWVDAKAEIVFDGEGRIASLRQIWQFDEGFTAFAVEGLDTDGDGRFSPAELEPLAKVNVDSLAEFGFFTFLDVGDQNEAFTSPQEYWLDFHGGRLTLFYTLPLATPVAPIQAATVQVYDPEFFVDFQFVPDNPVTLVDAPAGCEAVYTPPGEIDLQTLMMLSQIPADQRELPPELRQATSVLANAITVTCPQP